MPRGGLHQVCSTRHRLLHRARRRQAVPRGGVPQGGSRRLGLLQCAWRRQAVPEGRVPQGSCYRRHTSLPGAWRRQALQARGLLQGSRSSSWQCVLQAVSPARAARRCVGRCTAIAWRGPGAPSHGWDRGARARYSTGGGGWRVRGHPQASNRSDVQDVHSIESPSRVRRRTPPAHPQHAARGGTVAD
jgi:hypothetical protein